MDTLICEFYKIQLEFIGNNLPIHLYVDINVLNPPKVIKHHSCSFNHRNQSIQNQTFVRVVVNLQITRFVQGGGFYLEICNPHASSPAKLVQKCSQEQREIRCFVVCGFVKAF